jgi:hypothetical protein
LVRRRSESLVGERGHGDWIGLAGLGVSVDSILSR